MAALAKGRRTVKLLWGNAYTVRSHNWNESLYKNISFSHRCLRKHKTQSQNFPSRIFSGIQPTGVPHIGNYFGAIRKWIDFQNEYGNVILSVVDLHSITMPYDPNDLRVNIRDMIACLLACGIDPDQTILFQQSNVSEHSELCWILGCLTTLPRLQHLPQWQQKSEEMKEVPLGLFTYPVLQAADILLYKATDVPVGDDQVKHIELARHVAKLFNTKYGSTFPQPKAQTGSFNRIKSLRNPLNKMSKSEKDPKSRIELTDSADEIALKIKKAVTDGTSALSYDPEDRPGISNLLDIQAAFTETTPEEVLDEYRNLDSLGLKMLVAETVIENLTPIGEEMIRIQNDGLYLDSVMEKGADRAKEIAAENMNEVKKKVGFL